MNVLSSDLGVFHLLMIILNPLSNLLNFICKLPRPLRVQIPFQLCILLDLLDVPEIHTLSIEIVTVRAFGHDVWQRKMVFRLLRINDLRWRLTQNLIVIDLFVQSFALRDLLFRFLNACLFFEISLKGQGRRFLPILVPADFLLYHVGQRVVLISFTKDLWRIVREHLGRRVSLPHFRVVFLSHFPLHYHHVAVEVVHIADLFTFVASIQFQLNQGLLSLTLELLTGPLGQ